MSVRRRHSDWWIKGGYVYLVTYNIFYPFIKFDEDKSFGLFFVSCAVIRISYGGACLYSGTITSMGTGSDISHYISHKLAFVAALATPCDYPY